MEIVRIAFLLLLLSALGACSDGENATTPTSEIFADSQPAASQQLSGLDANQYKSTLASAMSWLRADYYDDFLQITQQANQMFSVPTLSVPAPFVGELFDLGETQIDSETQACTKGQVTREIAMSQIVQSIVEMVLDFTDCELGQKLYVGKIRIELPSDGPVRLDEQTGPVSIMFEQLNITNLTATANVRTLSGSFSNWSNVADEAVDYNRVYRIDSYSELSDGASLYITGASYIQELVPIIHFTEGLVEIDAGGVVIVVPETTELVDYRFTEEGRATVARNVGQQQFVYSIVIDSTLEYARESGDIEFPVFNDNLQAGKITYTSFGQGRITVTPDKNDAALVVYSVEDGAEAFGVVDDWFFPVQCNGNSVFDMRARCALGI